MSKFSEPATGKCQTCGDQLLSIPGRTPEQPRRVICPICTANELEEAWDRLKYISGGIPGRTWPGVEGQYKPTPEETERMGQ